MNQTVAIRSFPSRDEARDIAVKLEASGIACCVATEPGGVFATLYVAPADCEAASELIGDDGFDPRPLPNTAAETAVECNSEANQEGLLSKELFNGDRGL